METLMLKILRDLPKVTILGACLKLKPMYYEPKFNTSFYYLYSKM